MTPMTAAAVTRPASRRLSVDGVFKSFAGVPVLKGVSLSAQEGEILSLLGANGAGKTTLIKILCGVHAMDAGEIRIDGAAAELASPRQAIAAGVRLMPQEVSVHPELTVAENIALGAMPVLNRFGVALVDAAAMQAQASALLSRIGIAHIDPLRRMGSLGLAEQRLVEIARSLAGSARILILDEPTASLGEADRETLFSVLSALKDQGVTIVYVSHYLEEVFRLSDRIVVLRDGVVSLDTDAGSTTREAVLDAMLGARLGDLYPERAPSGGKGEPVLEVEELTLPGAFDALSFVARRGEVLGVFGQLGSGAERLAGALFGAEPQASSRSFRLEGEDLDKASPRARIRAGIGLVAGERKRQGLIGPLSVTANTTLPFLEGFQRGGFIDGSAEREATAGRISALKVRTTGPEQEIRLLSGGNQQKICLGRWMLSPMRLLILEEPTRGVDLGARRDIYREIRRMAEEGAAVLVISSDAEEIAGLSDRVLALSSGRIAAEIEAPATPGQLIQATDRVGQKEETMSSIEELSKGRDRTGRRPPLADLLAHPASGLAILLGFYALLLAGFSVLSPYFLTFSNLSTIGANMAFIGLMAAAGTPLIIAGGLDLSVAAIAGLAGVIVALLRAEGLDIWAASLVALAAGAAAGLINGLIVTRFKLNPLIATLGTMSIISGLSMVMTGGLSKPLMDPAFNWLGSGRVLGLPFPVVLMAAAFLALWVILAKTPFGRFVYASGGNPEASLLMGVPVQRTLLILYILSGLSGAVAGVLLSAMLGAAAPNAAGQHLLTIIAAIILGGTSLFGGRGSVWGTLVAVMILGTLNNGLTLMNVSSFWQDVTRGVVLLMAVGVDQLRVRLQG